MLRQNPSSANTQPMQPDEKKSAMDIDQYAASSSVAAAAAAAPRLSQDLPFHSLLRGKPYSLVKDKAFDHAITAHLADARAQVNGDPAKLKQLHDLCIHDLETFTFFDNQYIEAILRYLRNYYDPNAPLENKKYVEFAASILIGKDVSIFQQSSLSSRYIANLYSMRNSIARVIEKNGRVRDEDLMGLSVPEFLAVRTMTLLWITLQLEANSIYRQQVVDPDVVLKKIKEELLLTLDTLLWANAFDTLEYLNNSSLIDNAFKKKIIQQLVSIVAKKIYSLDVGKSFCLPTGWYDIVKDNEVLLYGHTIYLNFVRVKTPQGDKIVIYDGNRGSGVGEGFHQLDRKKSNVTDQFPFFFPAIIGELDLFDFDTAQGFGNKYLESIFILFLDWYKSNLPNEDKRKWALETIYKNEWTHQNSPRIAQMMFDSAQVQTASNCTIASFAVGSQHRVGQFANGLINTTEASLFSPASPLQSVVPTEGAPANFNKYWISYHYYFSQAILMPVMLQRRNLWLINSSPEALPRLKPQTLGSEQQQQGAAAYRETDLSNLCLAKSNSTNSRLLIVGSAGVGKTVFCEELIKQGSEHGKSWNFIIHLKLANLTKNRYPKGLSLCDVVLKDSLLMDDTLTPAIKEDMFRAITSSSTLILIDGYDHKPTEPADNYDSFVKELFTLPNYVVTTRLHSIPNVDFSNKVELSQFTLQQVKKYIEYYFKGSPLGQSLFAYLDKNAIVLNMVRIPQLLTILCGQWKKQLAVGQDFDKKTETKILDSVIYEWCAIQLDRKNGAVSHLSHEMVKRIFYSALKLLEKIAAEMQRNRTHQIPEDVLKAIILKERTLSASIDELLLIGFLQLNPSPKPTYQFLNGAVQEFFALRLAHDGLAHSTVAISRALALRKRTSLVLGNDGGKEQVKKSSPTMSDEEGDTSIEANKRIKMISPTDNMTAEERAFFWSVPDGGEREVLSLVLPNLSSGLG